MYCRKQHLLSHYHSYSWRLSSTKYVNMFNLLNPKSDQHLVSPDNNTAELFI